jgi:hypothetical protein
MNFSQISPLRFLLLILCVLLILFQGGCATSSKPHFPSPDLHNKLHKQRIALVPARYQLEEQVIFLRDSEEKFAANLGLGIAYAVSADPYSLILLPIVIPIAAVVYGIVEAIQATPKGVTDSIKQTTHMALEHFNPQINLSERVLSEANKIGGLTIELVPEMGPNTVQKKPDYRQLAAEYIDSILEIGVRGFGFLPYKGKDPELIFFVVADARIVDAYTLAEVYKQEFQVVRSLPNYSEWTANGVEMIEGKINEVLEELAKKIVENFFLSPDLGLQLGFWFERYGLPDIWHCCWICPRYPQWEWHWSGRSVYVQVNSLRPELRWDAFPNLLQARKIRKRTGVTVSDVRYDLRIWEAMEEKLGALVYERSGLILPSHMLDRPLSPKTRYFWSFRACFQLADAPCCTPWAFSSAPWTPIDCIYPEIPCRNYYRFQTMDKTVP